MIHVMVLFFLIALAKPTPTFHLFFVNPDFLLCPSSNHFTGRRSKAIVVSPTAPKQPLPTPKTPTKPACALESNVDPVKMSSLPNFFKNLPVETFSTDCLACPEDNANGVQPAYYDAHVQRTHAQRNGCDSYSPTNPTKKVNKKIRQKKINGKITFTVDHADQIDYCCKEKEKKEKKLNKEIKIHGAILVPTVKETDAASNGINNNDVVLPGPMQVLGIHLFCEEAIAWILICPLMIMIAMLIIVAPIKFCSDLHAGFCWRKKYTQKNNNGSVTVSVVVGVKRGLVRQGSMAVLQTDAGGLFVLHRLALILMVFCAAAKGVEGFDNVPNGCCTGANVCCESGLRKVLSDWIAEGTLKDAVVAKYGEIENWGTSEVTSLAYVFLGKSTFNADISKWDVSKVTTIAYSKFCLANC